MLTGCVFFVVVVVLCIIPDIYKSAHLASGKVTEIKFYIHLKAFELYQHVETVHGCSIKVLSNYVHEAVTGCRDTGSK